MWMVCHDVLPFKSITMTSIYFIEETVLYSVQYSCRTYVVLSYLLASVIHSCSSTYVRVVPCVCTHTHIHMYISIHTCSTHTSYIHTHDIHTYIHVHISRIYCTHTSTCTCILRVHTYLHIHVCMSCSHVVM